MSRRFGYALIPIGSMFFLALFVVLDSRSWASSNHQLTLFYERLAIEKCEEASARLISKEEGGLFLEDWLYETEIILPEQCASQALNAAKEVGFRESDPGYFEKDFGRGYKEQILLVSHGKILWVRDKI